MSEFLEAARGDVQETLDIVLDEILEVLDVAHAKRCDLRRLAVLRERFVNQQKAMTEHRLPDTIISVWADVRYMPARHSL